MKTCSPNPSTQGSNSQAQGFPGSVTTVQALQPPRHLLGFRREKVPVPFRTPHDAVRLLRPP